ncbi:Holliday junction branch migration protein RuvA [Candidatus Roizmanbacteria bacterium]|nr:Holliday junction branch migration protein RuvA [Candidatus Roizmanbacteria bacterium]
MIGKLAGILVGVDGNIGLIETESGVAYEVTLTPALATKKLPSNVQIYTYLQVRENAHVLFGFDTPKQKELFKTLIGVSGVGPKTAFSIISFSKVDELTKAVQENDVDYFRQVPGLGKKTAMKLILELSQKLNTEFELKKMYLSEEDKMVIDTLVALGFKTQDAKNILPKLPKNLSVEERVREGIKLASGIRK